MTVGHQQSSAQVRFATLEASAYLREVFGVKAAAATLEKLRCLGGGPAFQKFGRSVFYEREALDVWVTYEAGRAAEEHVRRALISMPAEATKPAPLTTGTGLGCVISLAASDGRRNRDSELGEQAVRWLAVRIRLPLTTARAVAEANSWGRA